MSTVLFTEPLLESERTLQEPSLLLPAAPFDLATSVQEKAQEKARAVRRTARRRVRLDWEALAVILLILVSGAICVYRIFWSMQP